MRQQGSVSKTSGTWHDYAIEVRTSFPDNNAWGEIVVHITINPYRAYHYVINPTYADLAKKFQDNNPPAIKLAEKSIRLFEDSWTHHRLEIKDGRLKVWLDGNLILEAKDSEPVESGFIRIGAGLGVMCLDDIRVTSLEK